MGGLEGQRNLGIAARVPARGRWPKRNVCLLGSDVRTFSAHVFAPASAAEKDTIVFMEGFTYLTLAAASSRKTRPS